MKRSIRALIGFLIVLGAFTVAMPQYAFALQTAGIIDVGNKICPITGDKISGKHFVEYEGKRYGVCCKRCVKKFKKNPEKYITELQKMIPLKNNIPEKESHGHGDHHH